MIHFLNERDNGMPCPPIERDMTAPEAIDMLVRFDLTYGGDASVIEPERLVMHSRMLNCCDTNTYTGPAREMAQMCKIALITQVVKRGRVNNTGYRKDLQRRLAALGIDAPLVTQASALNMSNKLKVAVCLAYDVEPVHYLDRFNIETVLAIVQLAAEEKLSFGQVEMLLEA